MKNLALMVILSVVAACAQEKTLKPIPDYPSATELLAMLDAGDTTSVAIVSEFLSRADANQQLHTFITIDRSGAQLRATELDALRERGELVGPLHGLPIVVKDNIHVAGLPNTAGTPGLRDFMPSADSPTIAALRNAGAIIFGKTNLHELAFGITSDNAEFGSVVNPFDASMFAGGSSGGTASAISAGIAAAGLGTDTGGSVRIPAALTGIVGFRPSSGRYDSFAVTPISHTRDTVGVMARTVADVVLLDNVIDGSTVIDAIVPDSIRLGIPRQYYYENVDQSSLEVIKSALDRLRSAGVVLVDVNPSGVGDLNAKSAFPIALYEAVLDLPMYLNDFGTGKNFGDIASEAASPDVQGLFAMLRTDEGRIPDSVYADAMAAREEMRKMFDEYFENNNLDGMIFPTTLLPSRPIEGSLETVELNGEQVPTFATYIHNTDPASIAGLPGISLPVGLSSDGLPIGLEIDGPEGSDRHLLAVAAVVEEVFDYSARPTH